MRAVVLTGHGGPDRLVVSDVPVPEPGPAQVRVRVTAAAVNNTDIWTREGRYGTADDPDAVAGWLGTPIDCPRIQGADVCGVVESVGPGVDPTRVGQRVVLDPATYAGSDDDVVAVLGSEYDGGFAEYVVLPADHAHDVTASPLDDLQVAALPIAYGTALGMLRRAEVTPGEQVLVTGASGGVGVALTQLAAALGATVVAVSTADKRPTLESLGATAVVDRHDPGVVTAARAAAGGGFDVVADVVGGGRFGDWIDALNTDGRLVVAGAIAGPVVELDLRRVYLGRRRIIGSTMHDRATFEHLVSLAVAGSVRPPIAEVFPLERLADAQQAMRSPSTVGKIVIDLSR